MEAYKAWVRRNSQWLSSMESLANVWTFFRLSSPTLLIVVVVVVVVVFFWF
jgi:hypothetical protein